MAAQPVLRHIVLIQFTDAARPQQIAEVGTAFRALATSIAAITDLEWGHALTAPNPYTHGLLVTFGSLDDLEDYNNHPAHHALSTRYGHLVQQLAVFDYWTAEPSGT